MLRNYFLIILRNLSRHRTYTIINLAGLSFGMTCAMLLYLYILDEMSYDRGFTDAEQVYKVTSVYKLREKEQKSGQSPGIVAPVLKKDYPEVERYTRLLRRNNLFVQYKDKKFNEKNCFYADKDFFRVFDYEFLYGSPETALSEPNTIVLSKSLAEKIFGDPSQALGKSLVLDFYGKDRSFLVSGVFNNNKGNSHLNLNALISFESVVTEEKDLPLERKTDGNWSNINFYSYIKLQPGSEADELAKKMKEELYPKYMEKDFAQFDFYGYFELQPIGDIRLYSTLSEEPGLSNTIVYVYIFSAIAFFIILLASINYMNLATARSAGRAREVGIRKVLGAYRSQLIGQFMMESLLLTFLASLLSLVMIELSLNQFNQLAGKNLSLRYLENPFQLLSFFGIALFVGLLSGSYPSFFLSRFNPVLVLKSKFINQGNSAFLRKGLVVFQFTISTVMMICTWVVYQQLQYVRQKDLGFDSQQILVVNLPGNLRSKAELIKTELKKNPEILGVAGTTAIAGASENNSQGVRLEDMHGNIEEALVATLLIDQDFLDVMGISLIEGRNYDRNLFKDTAKAVIVNETLAKKMAYRGSALDKKVFDLSEAPSFDSLDFVPEMRVIGVIEDFHYNSLHKKIEPMILFPVSRQSYKLPRRLLIKLAAGFSKETLGYIEETYSRFDQTHPYESYFLDQNFARQYEADESRGQVFLVFSFLAILIACLGLFGLASFTAEQRTKEIGIRKVLGATVPGILYLLSKQFITLILIANLLAYPIAWYFMDKWLEEFAYRITLWEQWYLFFFATLLTLITSILTISSQAFKAATTNPVNVLKNE